jgi:Family of unknown function (DUF5763)
MPVEQFNYRKPINGSAEGVKPLSQAWGDRVHGTDRVGSAGTSVVPAGLYSTAPYIDAKGTHTSPLLVTKAPSARHEAAHATTCTATRADGSPCMAVAKNGPMCGPHTAQANRMKEQSD